MQLGLVGLGRMGAGLAARLRDHGHAVAGFDLSADSVQQLVRAGGAGAQSLEDLVAQLAPPRALWVMVPHGAPTRRTIDALLPLLAAGDILIDGGNSHFPDALDHAARCAERGVHFLDIGVSGGIWGETLGFNLMVGGPRPAFDRLVPMLEALAPPGGFAHVGPNGAGHFVKMMHNAIEYAMLQALGEGFECLRRSDFDLDLAQVARLWENGSVVRSWLLTLLAQALEQDGNGLEQVADRVDDSGTGRWAVEFALSRGIPAPAMSIALSERFDSQTSTRFAHQVIAALRKQFGGHAITKA